MVGRPTNTVLLRWFDFNQLDPVDVSHFGRPWYQGHGSGQVRLVFRTYLEPLGVILPGFKPPQRDPVYSLAPEALLFQGNVDATRDVF